MTFQINYLFMIRGDLLDKFPVKDPRLLPQISRFQFNYRSATEFLSPVTFIAVLCFIEYITNQRAEVFIKRQSGGVILDPRLISRGGAKEEGVKTFYSVKLSVGTPPFRIYTVIANLHQAWSETGWLMGDDGEGQVPLTPFPIIYSNRWEKRATYRLHWFNPTISSKFYKRGRSFFTHLAAHIDLSRTFYPSPFPFIPGENNYSDFESIGIDRLFGFVLLSAFRVGWIMVVESRITNGEGDGVE